MRSLYTKLSLSGLARNRTIYLPYGICSTLIIALFFIILNLAFTPPFAGNPAYDSMWVAIQLSCFLFALLGTMIFLYINAYITQLRSPEWATYLILGFTYKNLKKVILGEMLLHFGLSLVSGLATGAVFTRMAYLILSKLSGLEPPKGLLVAPLGIAATFLWVFLVFVILYWRNTLLFKKTTPLSTLYANRTGQSKPRFSLWVTGLGLITLSIGYLLVLTTQRPTRSLYIFTIAILLVIIATFCLFTSGITQLLLRLQKNKNFYRRPHPFIILSGLLHRMKRNAAGLAGLCILSCMVLVTISTTFSLYIGTEDMLRAQSPQDFLLKRPIKTLYSQEENLPLQNTEKEITAMAGRYNLQLKNLFSYDEVSLFLTRESPGQYTITDSYNSALPNHATLNIYALEDYNRTENKETHLSPGEALLYSNGLNYTEKTIHINGISYSVTPLKTLHGTQSKPESDHVSFTLVVPTQQEVKTFQTLTPWSALHTFSFSIQGNDANITQFLEEYLEYHNTSGLGDFTSYHSLKNAYFARNGGFFFLGLFFSLIFLLFSALIIYYKQISEGYQDRERFILMQKVGMEPREVKKSIDTQLRFIFFIPLAVACIHTLVAFPAIKRALIVFGTNNAPLVFFALITAMLAYILVYYLLYRVTAKSYLHILRWKS